MNTFYVTVPEEPAGPLWDESGRKWLKDVNGWFTSNDGDVTPPFSWTELVTQQRMTDEPPSGVYDGWKDISPGGVFHVSGHVNGDKFSSVAFGVESSGVKHILLKDGPVFNEMNAVVEDVIPLTVIPTELWDEWKSSLDVWKQEQVDACQD